MYTFYGHTWPRKHSPTYTIKSYKKAWISTAWSLQSLPAPYVVPTWSPLGPYVVPTWSTPSLSLQGPYLLCLVPTWSWSAKSLSDPYLVTMCFLPWLSSSNMVHLWSICSSYVVSTCFLHGPHVVTTVHSLPVPCLSWSAYP